MIAGTVNSRREAIISLRVRGASGEQDIDAVVDTGFTGFLTLPPSVIATLGLVRVSRGRALLANGAEDVFDIYAASVLWNGQYRTIETDGADTDPLVGMSLLYGCALHVEAVDGGSVTIELLP